MHHPISITKNYFGDRYNQVAHTVQSVALQENGVPKHGVKMMLIALETMQFCLRTGFGESKTFFGGSMDNLTMGLGQ